MKFHLKRIVRKVGERDRNVVQRTESRGYRNTAKKVSTIHASEFSIGTLRLDLSAKSTIKKKEKLCEY